jgi:DNA-binding MarR family transcriptional regulator
MSTRTPTAEALTQLILEVFRVNGDLLAAGNRLTKPSGQTSARWQVLGALRNGPLTVAAIAREMGLARQSVQRTADVLADDGVVEFHDNPAHRRAKLVQLSFKGEEILGEVSRRQVAWTNGLAGALPFDEKRVRKALDVLQHLRIALERTDAFEHQDARKPLKRSVSGRKE